MAVKMRPDNKGLTVKVNLFSLENVKSEYDSEHARLWIKGMVTTSDGKKRAMFNDAGQLISILGKWNSAQLRSLQKAGKAIK
ncbi:MAG TPA: hypothetical protein VK210_15435 [Terriglobia bacterium]|nr:hypothetical protein [Terriglobia bacterium]